MKAIERISQYIDFKGLNNSSFEKKNDLSNGYIGTQLKRNADLGEGVLIKILDNCLDINPEWLLTGKGEMLKENVKSYPKPEKEPAMIPKLPIDAFAGLGEGEFIINENDIEEFYRVPEFRTADFLISVKGSSMQPKYNGGDIVACKHIHSYDWFQWGVPHVIHIKDRGVVVKRPHKTNDEQIIELRSDNERYESFQINKDEIINIAIVQGVIRVE